LKTLAVANNKGGVGKTTTATNVAAALVELGHRVLLVDLDGQGNLTYGLGVGLGEANNVGAFMLATQERAKDWPTVQVAPGLDLLPSHDRLGEYQDKMRQRKHMAYLLRNQLAQLPTDRFDYIVLDCPPSVDDAMSYNAFCAANAFVVPTDPEPFSVRGLARIMTLADKVKAEINPGLRFAGFVFTQYNPNIRGLLRQQMLTVVQAKYGATSILGNIRQDAALAEAQASGQSIFQYAPSSRGAADYKALTTTLLTKI
jgi:chromosome partitioning protein